MNFCVCTSNKLPSDTFDTERLTRDVRTKFEFAGCKDGEYNKKLYVRSDWEPGKVPDTIENGMKGFADAVRRFTVRGQPTGRPNL